MSSALASLLCVGPANDGRTGRDGGGRERIRLTLLVLSGDLPAEIAARALGVATETVLRWVADLRQCCLRSVRRGPRDASPAPDVRILRPRRPE